MRLAQSCVSSGTKLTAQFPSHGLGEPVAYGFQALDNGQWDSNSDRCGENQAWPIIQVAEKEQIVSCDVIGNKDITPDTYLENKIILKRHFRIM